MEKHEPSPSEVRAKIEQIEERGVKMFCRVLYVLCASESQIAGVPCKKERVYGPKGNEFKISQYHPQGISRLTSEKIYKHELKPQDAFLPVDIAVFTITRTKTEQRFVVTLPLDESFEPLTKEILSYYKEAQTKNVFDFNRKYALDYIRLRHTFDEFGYRGQNPSPKKQGEQKKLKKYGLDALRFTRKQELMKDFGFSDYEINVFEGTTNIDMPKPYELYLPKLLMNNPNFRGK
jgi:hypothetical protein